MKNQYDWMAIFLGVAGFVCLASGAAYQGASEVSGTFMKVYMAVNLIGLTALCAALPVI